MSHRLDHEGLQVYQASLAFVTCLELLLKNVPECLTVADQSDRTGTSVRLNIAEGNDPTTE